MSTTGVAEVVAKGRRLVADLLSPNNRKCPVVHMTPAFMSLIDDQWIKLTAERSAGGKESWVVNLPTQIFDLVAATSVADAVETIEAEWELMQLRLTLAHLWGVISQGGDELRTGIPLHFFIEKDSDVYLVEAVWRAAAGPIGWNLDAVPLEQAMGKMLYCGQRVVLDWPEPKPQR